MLRLPSLVVAIAVFSTALTGALQGQEGRQGGRGQQTAVLPEGDGKDMVQARCGVCHGVNLITGSAGYTRERWQDLISTMIKLPDDQAATVTQYLAAHFPPKPGREPVIVPGPVSVTFKEWITPTLGQRSRDPIQLADGSIFWAGQYGSLIGRLNPRTGEMKEWKLAPSARPHSIVSDRAGNIWYTGNANGTIGGPGKIVRQAGLLVAHQQHDRLFRIIHGAIVDGAGEMGRHDLGAGALLPDPQILHRQPAQHRAH